MLSLFKGKKIVMVDPQLCKVDLFGNCIDEKKYNGCLREGSYCGCACNNHGGNACNGYYCSYGKIIKLEPVGLNERIVLSNQYCRYDSYIDTRNYTCQHNPSYTYTPWSWRRSLKDYKDF